MGSQPVTNKIEYEDYKRRADVLVSFDGFLAVYSEFPDRFEIGPYTAIYFNSTFHEIQYIGLATYKDFKKYRRWYEDKKKVEYARGVKERQAQFWKSVSNLYGIADEVKSDNETILEVTRHARYTTCLPETVVCHGCGKQFVFMPEVGGMRQQLNYCPLCGRKAIYREEQ